MSRKRKQLQDGIKGPDHNPLDNAMYGGGDLPDEFWSGIDEKDDSLDAAITISDDRRVMQYGRFTFTPTSLDIPENATNEEWADMGRVLMRLDGAIQWALADWLAYGEDHKWGETYQQVAAEFDYETETLYTYAWVARRVRANIRREGLSFAHHRAVARLPADKQRMWLQRALDGENGKPWSVRQLKEEIKRAQIAIPPRIINQKLIDPNTRSLFQKMWRRVAKGRTVDRESIRQIREWLDEVERQQGYRRF